MIPLLLSVSIHGLLLRLDANWLNNRTPATPYPKMISISLVTLPPQGDISAAASKRFTDDSEKKTIIFEGHDAVPTHPRVTQAPDAPARQETATQASKTPVEKLVPEKVKPDRAVKPKISLKKITQKPPQDNQQRDAAQTKPQKDRKISKSDHASNRIAFPPSARRSTTAGKDASTDSASDKASSTLATKGDTSAGAAPTVARPLYRKNPAPNYPRLARKRGYEGIVVLEVLVNEKGTVDDLRVFESSGYELLDRAARLSVKKWLFEPGIRGGQTAKMWVRVPVRFKLIK